MNSFTIEHAQSDALPEILNLLKIAAVHLKVKDIDQWDYWLDPPQERLEWVKSGLENGQFHFIKSNEQLIGMYRLMNEDSLYWGKQDQDAYYLHSLVVKPQYAGKAIGQQIIDQLKNQAKFNGKSLLRLDCHAGNKALCNYYEKQGFLKVGQVQMPYSLNNLYEFKVI